VTASTYRNLHADIPAQPVMNVPGEDRPVDPWDFSRECYAAGSAFDPNWPSCSCLGTSLPRITQPFPTMSHRHERERTHRFSVAAQFQSRPTIKIVVADFLGAATIALLSAQPALSSEAHTTLARNTAPTYFDLIGGAVDAQLLKIIIEEVVSPLSIGAVLTS
jgi:hypothetical protein